MTYSLNDIVLACFVFGCCIHVHRKSYSKNKIKRSIFHTSLPLFNIYHDSWLVPRIFIVVSDITGDSAYNFQESEFCSHVIQFFVFCLECSFVLLLCCKLFFDMQFLWSLCDCKLVSKCSSFCMYWSVLLINVVFFIIIKVKNDGFAPRLFPCSKLQGSCYTFEQVYYADKDFQITNAHLLTAFTYHIKYDSFVSKFSSISL